MIYRKEIDGLKAYSVTVVILYQFAGVKSYSIKLSKTLDKLLDLSNSEKEEIKQFAVKHSWSSKFKHAIEIVSNEG